MEFARLEFPDEAAYIINLIQTTSSPPTDGVYLVDGIATTPGWTNGWFWVRNRYPINYPMKWNTGQPDNGAGNEQCLSIIKDGGMAGYNDVVCSGRLYTFICQIKQENLTLSTTKSSLLSQIY